MATRVGPATFCMVPMNQLRQHISRPLYAIAACMACYSHPWSMLSYDVTMVPCVTIQTMTDSVTHRWKFWGVNFWHRRPKSKSEEQRFVECHMENWRPKMAWETKKQFEGAWQTDRHQDRVNNKKIIKKIIEARRSKIYLSYCRQEFRRWRKVSLAVCLVYRFPAVSHRTTEHNSHTQPSVTQDTTTIICTNHHIHTYLLTFIVYPQEGNSKLNNYMCTDHHIHSVSTGRKQQAQQLYMYKPSHS